MSETAPALTELAQHPDCLELDLLALDDAQSRTRLEPFARQPGVTLRCGDLTRYEDVLPCVKDTEIIRTSGGHHFDGNYEALGDRILSGLSVRLQKNNAGSVKK